MTTKYLFILVRTRFLSFMHTRYNWFVKFEIRHDRVIRTFGFSRPECRCIIFAAARVFFFHLPVVPALYSYIIFFLLIRRKKFHCSTRARNNGKTIRVPVVGRFVRKEKNKSKKKKMNKNVLFLSRTYRVCRSVATFAAQKQTTDALFEQREW